MDLINKRIIKMEPRADVLECDCLRGGKLLRISGEVRTTIGNLDWRVLNRHVGPCNSELDRFGLYETVLT